MDIKVVCGVLGCIFALSHSLTCPLDWVEFKGTCYQFSSHPSTWSDAATACRTRGGHLVTDDSADLHNFLKRFLTVFYSMGRGNFWTGASDFAREGSWRWIATDEEISGFSAWGPGEPDGNDTANCMQFRWYNSTLGWADARCASRHDHHYYICQKSLSSFSIP